MSLAWAAIGGLFAYLDIGRFELLGWMWRQKLWVDLIGNGVQIVILSLLVLLIYGLIAIKLFRVLFRGQKF